MIAIHKVKREDLSEIAALIRLTWRDTYGHFLPEEVIRKLNTVWLSLDLLEQQVQSPGVLFSVARDCSGKAFGIATVIEKQDSNLIMGRLYVHPDFQRQGVGTKLLENAVRSFPRARSIELEVERNNAKGREFYKKHGFEHIGERNEHVVGAVLSVIRMKKKLPA